MIPLAVLGLARSWWKAGAGFVLGAVIAFPLGQCSGSQRAEEREQAARAVAITEALKTDSAAKEVAAGERLADAAAVADLKQELTDAVTEVADSAPTPSDVALGCARLRAQGTDVSDLPACGRPSGSAQAPAHR